MRCTRLRTHCYDDETHQENTWTNRARLSRKALTEDMRLRRYQGAQWMLGLRHRSQWYYENLVWADICNSVLPRSEKKAAEQALARKNGKALLSQGCHQDDKNLRGGKRSI